MQTNTPGLNKEPSQTSIDADYDALEQDLAENMARKNRSCCTRFSQYLCSFFKSSSPAANGSAELKSVVVNPTFSPNDSDSDNTSSLRV